MFGTRDLNGLSEGFLFLVDFRGGSICGFLFSDHYCRVSRVFAAEREGTFWFPAIDEIVSNRLMSYCLLEERSR
ncbi:MAG: hypothetical protein Ct9H300mP25_14120 [Acidobacteriota bacterium]|nr:MAG: hypothetical protein Ct9H300mP25_14120 [Acidobacteriota bacterium]